MKLNYNSSCEKNFDFKLNIVIVYIFFFFCIQNRDAMFDLHILSVYIFSKS